MKPVLPLSPRELAMARHHAEHSPTPEIREAAHRLLTDHELAVACGRPLTRAVARPAFRKSRPSPLGPGLTGLMVGVLALAGLLAVATAVLAGTADPTPAATCAMEVPR
ncbi:hypothetical protein [Rhodobacter sp. NSM]|uniref:hypothetical protein n=1 Tax=Rhodobacter sp. NSM TaxID=3457501 RepID=UPI003FD0A1C3